MEMRSYESERDLDGCSRIYGEIGWALGAETDRRAASLQLGAGRTLVSELNGSVEGFASNQDGRLRYLEQDLPACIVAGVGTGRVARRQGFAKRLTAEALALDVIEKQAAVGVLGMFDQGFYDQLGFGTGAPDYVVAFDPKDLRVRATSRVPVRLGPDDWERMHACREASLRGHGGVLMDDPANTQAELLFHKQAFGLGFEAEPGGELTHHLWITADAMGQGPYRVQWMAYRTGGELLELLGLLRTMADQIHTVSLVQPNGVQLWDLLERPWRRRALSIGSKHEAITWAHPWWQARICRLDACIGAVRLPVTEPLRFNLSLSDPIAAHLTEGTARSWSGVAGDYVVRLGAQSAVETGGLDPALPTLRTSVGTFSRLWLGVLPASGLAITAPDFDAPVALTQALERRLRLPRPSVDCHI